MKKLSVNLTRTEKTWGWIYYGIQMLILPSIIVSINILLGSPLSDTLCNFWFFGINFLCTVAIFQKYLKENARTAMESPFRCLRAAALGILIYWLLSTVVQFFILFIKPDFFNVNDAYIDEMAQENYGLIAFATVFLVPVAEESLYRGLMFAAFYNRNRLAAYVISTVVFSAVHIIGYIGYYDVLTLLLCFLQYLPAGLSLGWAYAHSDSVWAPILMHITINQISVSAMR